MIFANIYKNFLTLKQYIAFNMLSLIGLCDFGIYIWLLYMYWCEKVNNAYGIGFPVLIYLFIYTYGRLIVLGILSTLYLIEKILKKKIKNKIILQNRTYNIFWCFGIIIFSIYTIMALIFMYLTR